MRVVSLLTERRYPCPKWALICPFSSSSSNCSITESSLLYISVSKQQRTSFHVEPHLILLTVTVLTTLFQEGVSEPRSITAYGRRILQLMRVLVDDVVRTSVVVLILESCGSSCGSSPRSSCKRGVARSAKHAGLLHLPLPVHRSKFLQMS